MGHKILASMKCCCFVILCTDGVAIEDSKELNGKGLLYFACSPCFQSISNYCANREELWITVNLLTVSSISILMSYRASKISSGHGHNRQTGNFPSCADCNHNKKR